MCFENSFASHPRAIYWDEEKNGKATPRNTFKCSGKKIWFICDKCPHRFESVLSSITSNIPRWCPHCASLRSEQLARTIIEEYLFPLQFPKVRPPFLRGSFHDNGHPIGAMEYDMFNESINLAVEYNDHAEKFYRHTDEQHGRLLERDIRKSELSIQNGIILLVIPGTYSYRDESAMREFISAKLRRLNFGLK